MLISRATRRGFTLIELLVVVSIIALLIAILLPALGKAKDSSIRIQCLSYQRQMVTATTAYGTDNRGQLIEARIGGGGYVQHALNVNEGTNGRDRDDPLFLENSTVGERDFDDYGFPIEFFQDPGREFVPYADMNSFVIGYQYFGGIKRWNAVPGAAGQLEGLSPVTVDDMTSDKTMVACSTMKERPWLAWGQITGPGARDGGMYVGAPSHGLNSAGEPNGGNHVFGDGSGRWVQFNEMFQLQSWSGSRPNWYFQEDLGDYVPPGS
ncbi:MAG: prepilin-type N-terminal cleavage/methylation domain-containing protein [Planctomycetota bacterium]